MIEELEKANEIDGCTPPFELALQYSLCKFIKSKNGSLNTFEIGYFHGRTTELVLQAGSNNHIAIDRYADINPIHNNKIIFIKESSLVIENKVCSLFGKIDYAFIDGGHTYGELLNDLNLANKLLKDNGILVVDDIDLAYPEVIECLNDYLKSKIFYRICRTNKEIVLCRTRSFEEYYKYALYQLPIDMYKALNKGIVCEPVCRNAPNCLENFIYLRENWEDNQQVKYNGMHDWVNPPNLRRCIWEPKYTSIEDLNKQAIIRLNNA